MLAQSMTGRLRNDTELDLAIARSCWGGTRMVAGGDRSSDGCDLAGRGESEGGFWASENSPAFAEPLCDAKDAEKEEDEGEEEEEGDDFEEDDEDDEDEEFEGDDEFEDDDDEFFDGDDEDDDFDDDVDDEDDEDEDF